MPAEERGVVGQLIHEPARFDFGRVKRLAINALRTSAHSEPKKNLPIVVLEIDRFLEDWAGFLVWREKESGYRDNWRAELAMLRKQVTNAQQGAGS